VVGGTGAPLIIVKLREATDKATTITEGDEATGAASSPLVFSKAEGRKQKAEGSEGVNNSV